MRNTKLILLPIFAMSLGMLTGCNDEINSAISDIQSHIDDMQSDIDDLKNQIKDLKDQIAKLEGEMNDKIAAVKEEYLQKIAAAEAEIESLNTELSNFKNQYTSDKKSIEDDYNAKLAALEEKLQNADQVLANQLQQEKEALQADYTSKINALQTAYQSKVQEIESNIATLNTSISNLQTELANQVTAIQNDYNGKINDLTERVSVLEEVQTHTVSFDTKGAGEIDPQVIVHGEKARKPEDPVRAGATFKGWSYHDEPWYFYSSVVTEDMELVAQWELINYRVTFKNDDGTVLDEIDNVHYGETVTYDGETPIKPNQEDHYAYTFAGWDKELVIFGDTELIAQYDKEYLPFEERYLDAQGNILYQRFVPEEESLTKINYNDKDLELVDGHYRLEAEDAILSDGGVRVGTSNTASGGMSVGYFDVGTYVTFVFNVSQSTVANLAIGLSNGGGYPLSKFVRIVLNDEDYQISDGVRITDTHDWDTYLKFVIGEIHLKKGENTIVLHSYGGINLDYFDIENCAFDLTQEGIDEPTKANEETLMFSFRQWELVSNENNIIIYRPVFDAATIGLEFLDNTVELYHGTSEEVVVPSFWNKKVINYIGVSSFCCTDVKEVQLPDTIKEIGDKAFFLCERLKTINLPNNLKIIGIQAFDSTHSLKNITFNEGIETINYRAFEGSGLKEVILPENVEYIGDNAFGGLYADYIYVPATVKKIEWNCFYSPEGDNPKTNIIYTNKEYRPSTWDANWALRCVVVWGFKAELEKDGYKYATYETDGVKGAILLGYDNSIVNFEVPEEVNGYPVRKMYVSFKENRIIESVTLPNIIEKIDEDMFHGCTSLEYAYIPGSVKTIGERAFKDCIKLKTVVLNEGLEIIAYEAFAACYSLSSINLPESLLRIRGHAFDTCTSLTEITLPENLTTMDEAVFCNTSLRFIAIPKSIRVISDSLFSQCSALRAVVLPDTLISISVYAFYADPALEKIYYEGTEVQWNSLPPYDEGTNYSLRDATIYFYSETEPATPGNFWRYVEGTPTIW